MLFTELWLHLDLGHVHKTYLLSTLPPSVTVRTFTCLPLVPQHKYETIEIIGRSSYGSPFILLCFPDLMNKEDSLIHPCFLITSALFLMLCFTLKLLWVVVVVKI